MKTAGKGAVTFTRSAVTARYKKYVTVNAKTGEGESPYFDLPQGNNYLVEEVGAGVPGYGFDAYKEVYCDMISAGIVDPTKVTRSALQNAASVASMVLTTESLVADIKEPAPAVPAAPDMGGMY